MSSAECLEHTWLEEKEMENKTARISIENLRKFLARRKLKNVGRVLRAINVFKETARDSRFPLFSFCAPYLVLACLRSRSREQDSSEESQEETAE